MLLSLPGDNTRANFEEANRAFWRQTVIPLIARGEPGSTRFDIYQRDDALRRICVYDVETGSIERAHSGRLTIPTYGKSSMTPS